jgi:hypothetical protein
VPLIYRFDYVNITSTHTTGEGAGD